MTTREGTPVPRMFKCGENNPSSSRNLVVCIDDPSSQSEFHTKNTNIVELYSHITKNDQQLTYYRSGLGALAKVSSPSLRHRLSNALDMAIGRNLHKIIMAPYRWLSNNYQDGDRIFLFGYSRGAYQVRALAGMISRVGLLLPGNDEQIPFAFEIYLKTVDNDSRLPRLASFISRLATKESEQRAKYSKLAKAFKRTFCRENVHIHFVGVWDTVSSVGFGRGKTPPSTTASCEHICYFRRVLVLDERRVKFLPEYANGERSSSSDDGRIKEVWFAGSHSDAGGRNGRNDNQLLWMRSQAIAAGLAMVPQPTEETLQAQEEGSSGSTALLNLIHANDATLEQWRKDRLLEAIDSLSRGKRKPKDERHHMLATRAFLRARLRQWAPAIIDAQKSIDIQPNALAYVALGMARFGRGNVESGKEAFHRLLHKCNVEGMLSFVFLIKAVVMFTFEHREEAMVRVAGQIVGCLEHERGVCHAVQTHMRLIEAKACVGRQEYDKALELLADLQDPKFANDPHVECISLMFGWKFDSDTFKFLLYQQRCEALCGLGRRNEATILLDAAWVDLERQSDSRNEVKEWLQEFRRRSEGNE